MKGRVLITGGAGFIGSHLARRCVEEGASVRVLDNLATGRRENLAGMPVDFHEGSIGDRAAVAAAVAGCHTVFHLAAMVSVAESMARPRECLDLNLGGLLTVLEEASTAGARRLVFASSAAVYGDEPAEIRIETQCPAPRSPYAISKLAGEQLCDLFAREGRLGAASLRFFNVVGPRQDPRGAYAAAVPAFLTRALTGQPLVIHGDGGQTRDFVAVDDVVDALLLVGRLDCAGSYNVGSGSAMSILELARLIVGLCGSRSPIEHGPPRPGDVRDSRASIARLRGLGWEPRRPLADALSQVRDWLATFAAGGG